MTQKTRKHRSAEERISDLQAKIEAIRNRDQRRKARADPTVRLVLTAASALKRAHAGTEDPVLRKAIEDARVTLAAPLAEQSITLPQTATANPKRGRRRMVASSETKAKS